MAGMQYRWERHNRRTRVDQQQWDTWAPSLRGASYRLPAKFATVCRLCGRGIAEGEWILFKPGRTAQHERCPRPPTGRLALIRKRAQAGQQRPER